MSSDRFGRSIEYAARQGSLALHGRHVDGEPGTWLAYPGRKQEFPGRPYPLEKSGLVQAVA